MVPDVAERFDDKGKELVRVPTREPIHVRLVDAKRNVAPTNCPSERTPWKRTRVAR
jgi:hypothetical protein